MYLLQQLDSRSPSSTEGHATGTSVLTYDRLTFACGERVLVDNVSVRVKAGRMLAIMGPSGAGKSTLLDLMAFRKAAAPGATASLNDHLLDFRTMFRISCFVEQEDALLGVLTVRETITYALRLHSPMLSRYAVSQRVTRVINSLGLRSCAHQRIGTPIQRGISGGQKRRVTAACAMVTFPRMLFLDEVTSGLDSTAAREVMLAIRNLAVAEGIFVIATIHQPSIETLSQFTDLLLLSQGKTCFFGKVTELPTFFERWGRPVPRYTTPTEHAMNFLNDDFGGEGQNMADVGGFLNFYLSCCNDSQVSLTASEKAHGEYGDMDLTKDSTDECGPYATIIWNTIVLSERAMLNYLRNILAYGVRLGMYIGMGLMIATIWIRLGTDDSTINDRLSVHFYSVAFLAFMSVAGIPSFLEERAVFYRERKNGLYSTLPFVISNTLVNVPFLFFCTLSFTLIMYWAVGLHHGAQNVLRFLAFLLLAIIAAESQALIIASFLPVFVAALAIGAFMNGFWMSVGGYFIKARSLPRFWYYSFHFMDYQKYAFELAANSDFRGLAFQCKETGNLCVCAYPSSTPETCTVSGQDILDYLNIGGISYGKWVGVMLSIIVIYRIALYFALRLRSH